jgi:hypothetical protein
MIPRKDPCCTGAKMPRALTLLALLFAHAAGFTVPGLASAAIAASPFAVAQSFNPRTFAPPAEASSAERVAVRRATLRVARMESDNEFIEAELALKERATDA